MSYFATKCYWPWIFSNLDSSSKWGCIKKKQVSPRNGRVMLKTIICLSISTEAIKFPVMLNQVLLRPPTKKTSYGLCYERKIYRCLLKVFGIDFFYLDNKNQLHKFDSQSWWRYLYRCINEKSICHVGPIKECHL